VFCVLLRTNTHLSTGFLWLIATESNDAVDCFICTHTHQNITGLCWLKSETCYKIHASGPSPSGIKRVTVPTISIHQETWCSILNRPATHVKFSISLLKIYCYLLLCIKMLRFRMECENNTGYMKEYDSR
jgi:hypothetical protein